MIIPVRCFSCGKPIGHLWEEFQEKSTKKKETKKKALDNLGLTRYCCRAVMLGNVELIGLSAQFKKF